MSDPNQTGPFEEEVPSVPQGNDHHPEQISRYQVKKILGQGGFGIVYLAYDEQLQRLVAIKVPHRHLVDRPEDAEAYLAEARTVANLDHPNIVPVHDVGSTEECPFFVVSKYIEGRTLAQKIRDNRPSVGDTAELVVTVAETLHYAHRKGLVHRDIKPGNILLDTSGKPYVADFGLALKEKNIGQGPRYCGTPAYMSPEQARGEGHRVDGRSDIFSLGIVYYELLTGRLPFHADSRDELLEQITTHEPRPPRQWEDTIPKELERICLKALSKRASERYTTAKDFAEDLRHFLDQSSEEESLALRSPVPATSPPSPALASTPPLTPPTTPASDSQPIKIVPKGLRSFDSHDADFFLELLPGPRDREGLPDSIRFWKTRIEETDADHTFAVGLICGPSGCGKSSLVKAGLLPRLSAQVIPVYVEATANETEARLLKGLRKGGPDLPGDLGLIETIAALRRGKAIPGKKVLIVLDQFEQWLHARRAEENTELVQALRQCDGGRVQCVVMVRDDFWMAVIRFMRELEVRLVEGQNSAAVDLFPIHHAKKVLAAFGRAFGVLPDSPGQVTKDQQQFVEQAVHGLAQEGKVICVRLALFAEMVKGRPWTLMTLMDVGGTEGVGVTFLEETFSAATAPPEHRYHQKAARGVLKALLPESGTDIKGSMRSHAELLGKSGYTSRPRDFDDLIRILDSEIRLITPTDPEGKETENNSSSQVQPGEKYYQLTHDYLVPSLRDWLTRKQKETRRGRAELLLADRASAWNARPENRQLPSLLQWFNIQWLTQKKNWTPPQRKMMAKAGQYHAIRGFVVVACLILLGFVGWKGYGEVEGRHLRDRVLDANTTDVNGIVKEMASYRRWVNPLLQEAYSQAEKDNDPRKQLHASLALLPVDSGQVEYLYGRLLEGDPQEVVVIREALLYHKADLTERLWTLLEDPKNDQDQRFHAASALAAFAPDDPRWEKVCPDVAATLVIQKPFVIAQWTEALKGVGHWLIPPLADFLVDEKRSVSERGLIATVYGKYAADLQDEYARLVNQLAKTSEPNATVEAKVALAKKQASIGMALMVMGKGENVWSLMKHSPDPTLRSFLIERLAPGGVDPKVLLVRLEQEKEVSVKRAILLCLGEYGLDRMPFAERRNYLPRFLQLYRGDSDPGIHGAVEWLLRQWGQEIKLKELDDKLRTKELQLSTVLQSPRTEEQEHQALKISKEIEEIQQRLTVWEKELPVRQAAWERKLREQSPQLPPSLHQGLLVHFPLDEKAGTATANAVKNQRGGTYRGTGAPEWVAGVVDGALRLDGSGDILCDLPLDLECNQAFSYGCWFQYEGKPAMILISNRDGNKGFRGFDLSLEPVGNQAGCVLRMEIAGEDPRFPKSDPNYYFNKAFSLLSISVAMAKEVALKPPPSGWHHVLVTYDGSQKARGVQIFLDGKAQPLQILRDKLVGTIKSEAGINLGSRNQTYRYRGKIDDVRIYNRCVTDKEVQQLGESGIQALLRNSPDGRTPEQQKLLADYYRQQDEPFPLNSQLAAAQTSLRNVDKDRDWVRRWYINGQGQTMVVVANSGEFWMGEGTERHRVQIGRNFAIASKEVTVEQFLRFRKEHQYDKKIAPTDDCPVNMVSWYDAVAYCNWLSEQEGIPKEQWCYLPNKEGNYADGMKMAPNYLQRTGYRLPTEAEWEFSCRAGSEAGYSMGDSVDLLDKYGWFDKNSLGKSHPVGSLKSNDLGLFDMHGNAWEWCQDAYEAYDKGGAGKATEDIEVKTDKNSNVSRVLRGGSFLDLASYLRSASRLNYVPTIRDNSDGFRPARTLPLGSFTALPATPEGGRR